MSNEMQAWDQFVDGVRTGTNHFMSLLPVTMNQEEVAVAADRVMSAMKGVAVKNPKVMQATAMSVGRCVALCVMTGLMPGGFMPAVDLITRNKKTKTGFVTELDWQVGFRGYQRLAKRNGTELYIPQPVFEHEVDDPAHFEWVEAPLSERRLRHRPKLMKGQRGTSDGVVLFYMLMRKADGSDDFVIMMREDIDERMRRSESWRNRDEWDRNTAAGKKTVKRYGSKEVTVDYQPDSPWHDWWMEMACKTVVRYAAQRGKLTFDDVGMLAMEMEHADRAEVIDAADLQKPAIAETKRSPAALPDHGALDLSSEDVDEPDLEKVPVYRTEADDEAQMPPEPTTTPKEPGPKTSSYTSESDARALLEALGSTWKVPLGEEALRAALLKALDLKVLKPATRLHLALDYAVRELGVRTQGDKWLPPFTPNEQE